MEDRPYCKPLSIRILAEGSLREKDKNIVLLREQAERVSAQPGRMPNNIRTMLPGLSITINSRSLSSCSILTGLEVTGGSWRCTTFSIRSPLRTIVSALAILPLIVVTPDSRAYLCKSTRSQLILNKGRYSQENHT